MGRVTRRSTEGPPVYRSIRHIVRDAAQIFQPPQRLTVSQGAEEYRLLDNPGSYKGPWRNEMNPCLVEPMDTLTSRLFNGEIFVGPAQCGKTDSLILNFALYSIKIDPMDAIIFTPSNAAARDFSVRRVDRLHRHSPEVGAMLLKKKDADNKFDKHYKTGTILTISWPSVTELAGRPIPRVLITDYDRIDDDIGGDGNAFDLGSKRTTSFKSFAMTLAESSPSRDITDNKWIKHSPHEAPPCKGILALYNRGDRRRWYWPCPSETCGSYFEGNFRHLTWNTRETNVVLAAQSVRMVCPHCHYEIHPDERYDMQQRGVWLKDGQSIEPDGTIHGEPPLTNIASFWMNGVAAMFTTWPMLVQLYLTATKDFERTGSEDALTKFYNNDLGEPYMPKSLEAERVPETLQSRAEEIGGTAEEPTVDHAVRFLVATVDVQKNMFIVQVHGICPGEPEDIVIVDRFRIKLSAGRLDEDDQVSWVKPGSYAEDWDLITEQVIKKTYPLADGSGRRMAIKITACDSGGEIGVTAMAYEYFRRLRKESLGGKLQLVKGTGLPSAPRVRIDYPDSSDSKNKAAAHGDVPVLFLKSNELKDMLSNRLDCMMPGKGLIRFPEWLPDWFYAELCAEIRTEKGWERPNKARNEAWDLLYYCIGVCLSAHIKIEALDWSKPPSWAAPWDTNSLVSKAGEPARFATGAKKTYDFAAMGAELA